MGKQVIWTDQARADIRAIDRETAMGLLRGFSRYLEKKEGDVKRIQNVDPPEFRLRLGNYRLRFYEYGDAIEVLRVRHRREAYRD